MQINMTFEIDDAYIEEHLKEYPNKTRRQVYHEVCNTAYLALDCMNAMAMRTHEFGVCDYWVEKKYAE